ncbi:MAG: hypothetical protein LBI29_02315 [Rickettsiales bacterium]|jgi:hypothetical protein|nr:hypothetical protein [Rickettsiales bacterium]
MCPGGLNDFVESNRSGVPMIDFSIESAGRDLRIDIVKEPVTTMNWKKRKPLFGRGGNTNAYFNKQEEISKSIVKSYVDIHLNDLMQEPSSDSKKNEEIASLEKVREAGKYSYDEIAELFIDNQMKTEKMISLLIHKNQELSGLLKTGQKPTEDKPEDSYSWKVNLLIVDHMHSPSPKDSNILERIDKGDSCNILFKSDSEGIGWAAVRVFRNPFTGQITVLYNDPNDRPMDEKFKNFLTGELDEKNIKIVNVNANSGKHPPKYGIVCAIEALTALADKGILAEAANHICTP